MVVVVCVSGVIVRKFRLRIFELPLGDVVASGFLFGCDFAPCDVPFVVCVHHFFYMLLCYTTEWNYRLIDKRFCRWRSSATPPLVAEYDRKWRQLRSSDGLEHVMRKWGSLSGDEKLLMQISIEQTSTPFSSG